MNSVEKPSIGEILKQSSSSVSRKTENYLHYYDDKTADDDDGNGKMEERKGNSTEVTNYYYDLATDFYEYGWGESFHFAVMYPGESREHSFAKYEYALALKLGLKPGELVLDVGCGIGGPSRHIASFSDSKIVGLNCNDYQLMRARLLTKKVNLQHLCSFVKGDYHSMSFSDGTFDKAYAIEATCHSPNLTTVYSEVYRVLKPGGIFGCCEWVMTDKYDPNNSYHKQLKEDIMVGDGLPDVLSISRVHKSIHEAGFEIIEARDRSMDTPLPWYSVLQPQWTLSDLKITPLGRWLTHVMLMAMETVRLAPKGSVKIHRTLCKGADALTAAGVEGIFSPLYLLILRKPA